MAVKDRLLRSAIPHTDESFAGYLLRLTERNHYDNLSWILRLINITRNPALAINRSFDLSRLKALTGVSEDKLGGLLYPSVKRGSKLYDYVVFDTPLPPYMIRLRYPKLCPGCLRESPYARKVWEIAALTACPIHKNLLLDECPHCKKRISWSRESVSKCKCSFDWRAYVPPPIGESEVSVATRIFGLCNLSTGENTPTETEPNNPLYRLKLDEFLSALFFIAGQHDGIVDIRGKYIACSRRNSEIHALLCKAYSVFRDWPNNYLSFLEWRQKYKPDTRYCRGLIRDFGPYQKTLYKQLAAPPYDFLRAAFEDYLLTKWDGGTVSTIPSLKGRSSGSRKYLSKKEAVKILGIDQYVTDQLIAKGSLKAIIQKQGKSNMFLIEAASVQSLREHIRGAVGISYVSRQFGVLEQRVREIIEAKLITPILDPREDEFGRWRISKREINRLLSSIKEKVVKRPIPSYRRLKFLNVLKKLARYNIDTGQFVRAILDGKIIPCSSDKKGKLSSLSFPLKQILEYERHLLLEQTGDAFTPREAAAQLNVSVDTIYALLEKGILLGQKIKRSWDSIFMISKADLDEFEAVYSFPYKVAEKLGTNSTNLTQLLIENGVQPISYISVNRRIRYLFKKHNLELLDLSKIVFDSRNKKIVGFKNRLSRSVSMEQAAKELEITVNDLLDLADRGILKPYRKREGPKENYSFTRTAIEKYRNRRVDYTGLVSRAVAAKMMGKYLTSFTKAYVHTHRLKVIKGDGRIRNNFFRLDEIKKLIEELKNEINTPTVASILGVNPSAVQKMVKDGKLKVIRGPYIDGYGNYVFSRSEVEKLTAEREDFKVRRIEMGGSSRFGSPAGPKECPVMSRVSARIEQLIKKWGTEDPKRRITGHRLHQQLSKEGYQVGITTVYVYLAGRHPSV
jgi:excisionase family DNA binding protein